MTNNLIFNVNVDILLRAGISINQHFMLQLIKNQQAELYIEYRTVFPNPVTKEDLQTLINKGYLATRDDPTKFTFENLFVTQAYLDLSDIKVEDALKELSETYPTKSSGTGRRLQAKSEKWGPKYLSIIKKDRSLHDKIIKCIKAEAKHRKSTGNEEYWSMLLTYVNNKMWDQYIEDIDNKNLKEISNNYDI